MVDEDTINQMNCEASRETFISVSFIDNGRIY